MHRSAFERGLLAAVPDPELLIGGFQQFFR